MALLVHKRLADGQHLKLAPCTPAFSPPNLLRAMLIVTTVGALPVQRAAENEGVTLALMLQAAQDECA